MRATFLIALTLFIGSMAFAQKFTISGFISDAETGEKLIGASVYTQQNYQGTTSNNYGFFSLTLPSDTYNIVVSYVGFSAQKAKVNLNQNITVNFELASSITLKTFEVTSTMVEQIQERSQMSAVEIPMKSVEIIPALLGERDILKVIQLLPGVQSGGEGTSGLYVRGGGPDQNLILLDGVPVYNASHLFGFFSVFNNDAINSVELIKGGFPARYGGRLSSVIDIRMKEGNLKKWQGSGSIGLVSSKLTIEGPIWKDKTSIIVSGRRTYIDLLARPIIRRQAQISGNNATAGYYFYDLNAKINHKFNDKSRLFLSAYLGDDRAYARFDDEYTFENIKYTSLSDAGLGWGNLTTALRYNHVISKKVFSNTTLTYSRYRFEVGERSESTTTTPDTTFGQTFEYTYNSGIEDVAAKIDFDILPNPNHYIKTGVGNIYHTFTPGVNALRNDLGNTSNNLDTSFGAQRIYAHELFAYAEDDIKVGARLKVNVGLHYSGFISGKTQYHSLQPRISGRFLINDDLSIKASYAEMAQFIHLLTNGTIGLPTDLWVPSTNKVKPQNSQQVALGLAQTFKNMFEVSVEGYYKSMQNIIEYKEGASFFSVDKNWDEQIEFGTGNSYGAELFVQKKEGKTTGWIGYTLSWTNRQFDNLNFGNPFPFRYDRRHDIGIVVVHQLNERIDFGVTWVYGTGNAVTLATTKYPSTSASASFAGFEYLSTVQYFENRNDFRMPSYHRLDVGVNFKKPTRWGERTWSFGAYNTYNRRNPFYLYFENQINRTVVKQVSLFPIIPFISYSFKF